MTDKSKSWVLVTGASSGFGVEFAKQYAEQGRSLILVARTLNKLENLATELRQNFNIEVIVEQVDLSSIPAVTALHQRLRERDIVVDVLINNAGHGLQGPFLDEALDHSLAMIDLDIRGWLAGVAYQIPEIALKASVTYRSEIDHKMTINESSIATLGQNIGTFINMNNGLEQTKITTPQSVNLDFQTGIMANTIAFANMRWVNWKDFTIRPYAFGLASEIAGPSVGKPNGFDLTAYSDDQWSANVGLGRKLNDQWMGNISVGWDSGAGNPVTALGPTEGYWNLGLGAQFSPTPQTFISGGVKYFWLGDAKLQTSAQFDTTNYVAEFKDNYAIAYGLKMGYKF